MAEKKNFSLSELEVMNDLWQKGPASPGEVYEKLSFRKFRECPTVCTFIFRLYEKSHQEKKKADSCLMLLLFQGGECPDKTKS